MCLLLLRVTLTVSARNAGGESREGSKGGEEQGDGTGKAHNHVRNGVHLSGTAQKETGLLHACWKNENTYVVPKRARV